MFIALRRRDVNSVCVCVRVMQYSGTIFFFPLLFLWVGFPTVFLYFCASVDLRRRCVVFVCAFFFLDVKRSESCENITIQDLFIYLLLLVLYVDEFSHQSLG